MRPNPALQRTRCGSPLNANVRPHVTLRRQRCHRVPEHSGFNVAPSPGVEPRFAPQYPKREMASLVLTLSCHIVFRGSDDTVFVGPHSSDAVPLVVAMQHSILDAAFIASWARRGCVSAAMTRRRSTATPSAALLWLASRRSQAPGTMQRSPQLSRSSKNARLACGLTQRCSGLVSLAAERQR